MWELIQANRRKSIILFLAMGLILILLGFFLGETFLGQGGGPFGIFIAVIIWSILSLVSYFAGSSIILSLSNAKEVTKDVHPQLFNIVEEMSIAANLPKIPKIYIVNEQAPNAFATGRKPEDSVVAVTAGLLSQLNRDELQGVIAHEISHIINRDILFMTFAGIMLGAIVIISEVFLRGYWIGGGSLNRYKNKSSGGGNEQIIIMVFAMILAISAPILAQLLYFAISRKREYLADASGVRLTRYPEGLASALEKLSQNRFNLNSANKATAGMYIVNPIKKTGMQISDLSSTHPPISERIKILRGMMHGVDFADYQTVYNKIKNNSEKLIPDSGLKNKIDIPIVTQIKDAAKLTKKEEQRKLGDIVMNVNGYNFFNCKCGVTIKVPPTFKSKSVKCPRCGEININSAN
ncbi:MAG: M48 family metallopeptidase [Ignavibacteriales bacterium]|nr:M48 family metallopeptidase [Ignavibacteriales bacterium]MCB9259216.1 M48 family metallopeptidase [Ignavibacteriales bacterium]